ncbi:MAG: DNA adenine methylase [Mariprofundaceae bacterium]
MGVGVMGGAVVHDEQVQRPPLRYHGGKWRIAKWIISHFPAHTCYVEPFGGGGSVLLRKAPSLIEVYNDLDRSVVNFFRVLRDRPEDLARAIEMTPWSREELRAAREDCEDALESARRRYVLSMQSRAGGRVQSPGWRFQTGATGKYVLPLWNDTTHLLVAAARLKMVQIECDDALAVISRFDGPETLFYVDPPYLPAHRNRTWAGRAYQHEMDEAAHHRLLAILRECEGMVVLSGYDSEMYRDLLHDWSVECSSAVDGGGNVREERLWINPAAVNHMKQARLF